MAVSLKSLVAKLHESFNERDLDAWSDVFDDDVELVVDGAAFRGVAGARGYAAGVFREFPGLRIDDARVVAESADTIVVEYQVLNGDPSGGPLRRQGSVCEIYHVRDERVIAYTSYYAPEEADREDVVNVPSRAEGSKMAEEQAALRRVATLVARGVSQDELFAAVNEEVGWLVGAEATSLMRFEADDMVTLVATWSGADAGFPVGARLPVDDELRSMRDDGRAVRFGPIELPSDAPFAEEARQLAIRSAAGVPIVVDGRVWGAAFAASTREEPFPEDTSARMAGFTELVATAIANTEARTQVERLADEQAALRRVATLAARGAAPEEVFAAVTEEIGRLLGVDSAGMARYEPDRTLVFVASWGGLVDRFPVGSRMSLAGRTAGALVFEGGVETPVIVEGRLWGVMGAGSSARQPLPADTEARLASFTELLATAIANAESRARVSRLAEEQAALRRVATLVAAGAPPEEAFAAVAKEFGRLFLADVANMCRYEPDGTFTIVASAGNRFPVGSRWTLGGKNVTTLVFETGRPGRLDSYADATGPLADDIREKGIGSAVATPIVVAGRLWGAVGVASYAEQPLPADTEARLASFADLVAMAIANADARTEVAASRARIVAATDDERRRVVRDLHDGAQQRLVHTIITLKLAQRALGREQEAAPALVGEALGHAERANAELRELAHGILPAVVSHGGLRAGVDALASRTPVPVEIDVSVGRLPHAVEATAYFVVAEALTNVAKHARAGRAEVMARIEDRTLAVQVRDDGVGGAQPGGSGLVGLADRLAALDGRLRIESPAGGGTLVAAAIPLPG